MSENGFNGLTDAQLMFLYSSLLWSKGSYYQGKRLLAVMEENNRLYSITADNPDKFNLHANSINELTNIQKYEEDFFILALYNMFFYLNSVSDTLSGFRRIVDDLEKVNGIGQIKDVRDMRVHIDDYIKGKGKAKERFVYESDDELFPSKPFAEHLYEVDATSTIIMPGAYMIGGRINFQKTLTAIEDLLPVIMKTYEKHMRFQT